MSSPHYAIRTMTKQDIKTAIDWAAAEGWNPGLHDAESFYAADPSGFLIGEIDGEPVSTLSAVKYGNSFGFMGFYIVKPTYRGKGYGIQLWNAGIKYPPPEGVVLGLPLEGDKIALPPKEARRAVPKQVLPLISNQNLFAQLLALAFLDTSHRHGSFLHPNLLYQHSSHGPKSDYPNTAFALTP